MSINSEEIKNIRSYAHNLMADINDEKSMAAALTVLHLVENYTNVEYDKEYLLEDRSRCKKFLEILLQLDWYYAPEVKILIQEFLITFP